MTVTCNESEMKWLIKALENSEYGCPKLNSLSRCITYSTNGCTSGTFNECIRRQINFDVK